MPKVSIILPLYNSENFIRECLYCISNQSFKDYELIILDDCSTDKTRETLEKRNLKYHKNEINLGFVKNLNQGIKMAKGEYIMVGDHDMVYEKDYIKKALSENGDIIAGRVYYYKEKNKIRSYGISMNLLTGKTTLGGKDEIDSGQYDYMSKILAAPTGALIIKKDVFEKAGLFDESFNKHYADIDFCYRARKAGFKVLLSKGKCWHKKEEKDSFNKQQLETYYKDKKLFLKNHSPYYPLSLLPIKIKNLISGGK